MNRYEFLKKTGFTGGALMALISSCVTEKDKYVTALVKSPDIAAAKTDTTKNTGANTGNTDIVATKANSKTFVSTADLGKLKSIVKIDLSLNTFADLNKLGGYVIVNNSYVIALSNAGTFLAATITCSHQPRNRMIYSQDEWYCTDHGARFSQNGTGLNNNGKRGLTVYNVATDGKTLVVY
jgi:nitrite reductase/ring-hydroxylating ferredoxin subunit